MYAVVLSMEDTTQSQIHPRKRIRLRFICPHCSVNLSKSSYYEHVGACSKNIESRDGGDDSDSSFEVPGNCGTSTTPKSDSDMSDTSGKVKQASLSTCSHNRI